MKIGDLECLNILKLVNYNVWIFANCMMISVECVNTWTLVV
jgi:hypothetical protein